MWWARGNTPSLPHTQTFFQGWRFLVSYLIWWLLSCGIKFALSPDDKKEVIDDDNTVVVHWHTEVPHLVPGAAALVCSPHLSTHAVLSSSATSNKQHSGTRAKACALGLQDWLSIQLGVVIQSLLQVPVAAWIQPHKRHFLDISLQVP